MVLFPNTKKITLVDYKEIEQFISKFPPYNDFEFTSLWTYNTSNRNTYTFLNDNLVIKIQDFVSGEFFYSFLGTNKVKDTIDILLKKSHEENIVESLYLVPEICIKSEPNLSNFYSVNEDPNSFDYILSVSELSALSGSAYHDKRYMVNKFLKTYPHHQAVMLDLNLKLVQDSMIGLFYKWEKQSSKTRTETQIELTALNKLFDLTKLNKITGIGVIVNNELVGFSTYNIVQEKYAIISFEKGDYSFSGIYEYLKYQTARQLNNLGCEYINYEQDLGIPGLRNAKKSWNPKFYLKKYIIKSM